MKKSILIVAAALLGAWLASDAAENMPGPSHGIDYPTG